MFHYVFLGGKGFLSQIPKKLYSTFPHEEELDTLMWLIDVAFLVNRRTRRAMNVNNLWLWFPVNWIPCWSLFVCWKFMAWIFLLTSHDPLFADRLYLPTRIYPSWQTWTFLQVLLLAWQVFNDQRPFTGAVIFCDAGAYVRLFIEENTESGIETNEHNFTSSLKKHSNRQDGMTECSIKEK